MGLPRRFSGPGGAVAGDAVHRLDLPGVQDFGHGGQGVGEFAGHSHRHPGRPPAGQDPAADHRDHRIHLQARGDFSVSDRGERELE